jgi:hypothetical protein
MLITLEDLAACLLEDTKTVITTLTNYGYLLYTLNMLKSLKPFGLYKKVFIVDFGLAKKHLDSKKQPVK